MGGSLRGLAPFSQLSPRRPAICWRGPRCQRGAAGAARLPAAGSPPGTGGRGIHPGGGGLPLGQRPQGWTPATGGRDGCPVEVGEGRGPRTQAQGPHARPPHPK